MICFNPRTHTGCDPACKSRLNRKFQVSIHAPTRGATARFTLTGAYSISFNPRTHTGCDDPHIGCYNHVRVSIHAPTRGATRSCSAMGRGITCFNPRTHTGCDIDILLLKITGTCFNPRTHTGCDTPTGLIVLVGDMFQSTHPHGVRPPKVTGKGQVYFVFQSTHPHGVRHLLEAEYLSNYTFQSTHPHGVRQYMIAHIPLLFRFVSIHAPTRGATSMIGQIRNTSIVSIHAPTRGATLPFPRYEHPVKFQSTHPHGVRHSYMVQLSK